MAVAGDPSCLFACVPWPAGPERTVCGGLPCRSLGWQPDQGLPQTMTALMVDDDNRIGCAPGTYWVPHTPDNPREACRPCPVGAYCPGVPYGRYTDDPVNLNRRILCPAGRYNDVEGAASLEECRRCSPGRFNNYIGRTECTDCPAGRYSETTGSSNGVECVICPVGHHCHRACGRPIPCDAGSYVSFEGMWDVSQCNDCPHGSYCPIGSVYPTPCKPGSFGNRSRIQGSGSYPDTFLPVGWVDTPGTGFRGTGCSPCWGAFFCVEGSVVPRQCPPGTMSANESKAESDCTPCAAGQRCQMLTSIDTLQSLVTRRPDGATVGGAVTPEACRRDAAVRHFSYPQVQGCVEHCPYSFSQQSFCHVAGDGRLPDRSQAALRVSTLVLQRRQRGFAPEAMRQAALGNLTELLDQMTEEERNASTTMLDTNGRTPLMLAAMMGDVPLLKLLWVRGGASDASAARDADGFTALMLAMLLDSPEAAEWLGQVGMRLTSADVSVLQDRGVDVPGLQTGPLEQAPAYLGRGGLSWTHPSGADFQRLPLESPMPTTSTSTEYFTTTTTFTATSTTMTQTNTVTTTVT
eukprot:TRINITY_DN105412_c0_g1_i1.p1 TRINITY_DN105412_c0_g1~~TRINITY_DN105412_c0_g1_i1.p1  ORF type:complete len:577 (-),score=71.86 TRINITY_DN105412_c0_g1_i1:65-1795(-)